MHRISLFDFIAVAAATLLLAACAGGPFARPTFSTANPATHAADPVPPAAPAGVTATLENFIATLTSTVAPVPTAARAVSPAATGTTTIVTPRAAAEPARVSWDDARALILAGKVKQAEQSHAREVRLTLRDGSEVHTVEPALDDVLKLARSCGGPCAGMLLVTE